MLPELKKVLDLFANELSRDSGYPLTPYQKSRLVTFQFALCQAHQELIDIDSLSEHDKINQAILSYEPEWS